MDINSLLSPSDDSPSTSTASPHSRPHLPATNSASSVVSISSTYQPSTTPPVTTPLPPPQQAPAPPPQDHAMPDATPVPSTPVPSEPVPSAPPPPEEDPIPHEDSPPFTEEDQAELESVMTSLKRKPYQYTEHQKCIGLLRRAFLNAPRGNRNDLLLSLRQAREEMVEKFPLKESMWLEWIRDEWSEARGFEGRLFVMELCGRSVVDQVASTKLWKQYAEYVEQMQRDAYSGRELDMTPQDAEQFRDLFQLEVVIDTWRQGAQATKSDIADGHEMWDRYRDFVMDDLERTPTAAKIEHVYDVYRERLKVPHLNIADTFSSFSGFVTRYDNANYEQIMVDYNKLYAAASEKYRDREMFEIRLKRVIEQNPETTPEEWQIWTEYLQWETTQPKKKMDVDMASFLYERCLLRFGEQALVWEDYVDFMLEKANTTAKTISLLQRATRHCPWSGALWAQYIIALEKGFKPFEEVSEVKHKATKTELLDLGGPEEVLQVNIAWCGFLKRRAFEPGAAEEDYEVAEMGIAEAVSEISTRSPAYKDPFYRIHRIQIGFYTRAKKLDAARGIWKKLAKEYAYSHEFWLRYYEWELAYGGNDTAGAVIKAAVGSKNLDGPDKILDTWRAHVEDCGDVNEVETMMVRYRKARKEAEAKRAYAYAQHLEQQQAAYAAQQQAPVEAETQQPPSAEKRKREEEGQEDHQAKKAKSEDETPTPAAGTGIPDQQPTAEQLAKRDRENTTVIVRNLPPGYPQVKLRQFFRDCGKINSLAIVDDKSGQSSTATIEFDTKEDTLSAQIKDGKIIDDREIQVQIGTGSTLYVTNFPPLADAAYIRNLFKDCGEIVDIRFPSLKFNQHRRFCYVQFTSPEEAQRATALHGTPLGQKETLVALISAPNQKKERSGATQEGRELFIRNIDFSVTDRDIASLFEKFGKIEKIRLPPGPRKGTHKGFGFVVFTTKDAADAALAVTGTDLKGRVLDVSIAQTNPAKIKGGNVVDLLRQSSPDHANGTDPRKPSFDQIKTKTLGVMNLPDTLNDMRLHALFAPFGPLRKVTLRPDHSGAIVEYETVADAGKASLAMEGKVVDGNTIRIGTLEELMQQKPLKKKTKGFETRKQLASATAMVPASVRNAGAARGARKRGGLGFTGAMSKAGRKEDADAKEAEPAKGRSNDDFKKMFLNKE